MPAVEDKILKPPVRFPDGRSDTSPKRFTRPARMAADLFPPPLSYCWTMIFFEKAFALCEVMLYFEGTA
ncbi:hypothetical protein ACN2CC_29820 [Mesorhizobium muleiense]|uniref:hypothetical protein n=1 Tax=Mesorhizobium muleiense TaxID=1004279 RepID=UPI003AFB3769